MITTGGPTLPLQSRPPSPPSTTTTAPSSNNDRPASRTLKSRAFASAIQTKEHLPHLDHHHHHHVSDTPSGPGVPPIAVVVVAISPLSSSAAPTDAHALSAPADRRRHAMMVLADDNAHAMPVAPPRLVPGRRRRRQVVLWDEVAGTRGRNVMRVKINMRRMRWKLGRMDVSASA